jgi:hypothetical protein
MAFVGKHPAAAAAKRGSGSSRGAQAGAAAAAMAGGGYATTVQDDHEEDDDGAMADVHGENGAGAVGTSQEQQRLARAIRRNAGGGGSSWLAAAGGSAGSALRDRSEAVKAAGAGVMASLLEAAGRAAARQKHLEQNLSRTTANLTGALEEVERVRVSWLVCLNIGLFCMKGLCND